MEELSYYFNGDLENFLSLNLKEYKVQFNKFNQEFEFLIALIENKPLHSNRNYSKEYINYLKDTFNVELKISTKSKNITLWCSPIYNIQFQKKINSRFFTQQIANRFNEYQAKKINHISELEQGYLYKEDFSVSGNGNYKYPKDKLKIEKRLKSTSLIKDTLYDRDLDISTLIEGEDVYHYENIVDEHFQYRGSIIGKDLSHYSWFSDYEKRVNDFIDMKMPIEGPYSIDSFIYNDQIYFMTEINNRKTMGYISKKIKDAYFTDFKYLQTLLIPTRKIKNYNLNLKNVYLISPKDNLFGFFILVSNNLEELKEMELELFAIVFD